MDSWFHAAVHSSDGNQKMVAEDPLRKLCLGRLKNVPAQVVCIALVALQAVLLNHHLQVVSIECFISFNLRVTFSKHGTLEGFRGSDKV